MLELAVPETIVRYAEKIVSQHSFGNRGRNDGSTENQINGMIAQTMVCDWLNRAWPVNLYGPDRGHDLRFGDITCDIKSTTIPGDHDNVPDYVTLQVIEDQIHNPVDFYLFTVYIFQRSVVFIVGCVAQFDFKRNCIIRRSGEPWHEHTNKKIRITHYSVPLDAARAVYNESDLIKFAEMVNWRKNQWHQKRFPPVELPK